MGKKGGQASARLSHALESQSHLQVCEHIAEIFLGSAWGSWGINAYQARQS